VDTRVERNCDRCGVTGVIVYDDEGQATFSDTFKQIQIGAASTQIVCGTCEGALSGFKESDLD
jgi:hypothetical protein